MPENFEINKIRFELVSEQRKCPSTAINKVWCPIKSKTKKKRRRKDFKTRIR